MYRIYAPELTQPNSELPELAETQSRDVLRTLLDAQWGNFEAQEHSAYIGFIEKSVIPRIRQRYNSTLPNGPVSKRKHYDRMMTEMMDLTRYCFGENYVDIATSTNRTMEEVEVSVSGTIQSLIADSNDNGRAFRREYQLLNPNFRTDMYPGLLRAIKVARPNTSHASSRGYQSEEYEDQASSHRDSDRTWQDTVGLYLGNIARVKLLSAVEEVELSKRIEGGLIAGTVLQQYSPWLNEKQREELTWLEEDGRQAKERFYLANLRLVVSIARKYSVRESMTIADYIQEGNLGLMRAVEKFDYTKGYKFSTYASNWIKQSIQRGIMMQDNMIRKPTHTVEDINALRSIETELINNDLEPTAEDIAIIMECTPERVRDLMEWRKSTASLDAPLGNSNKRYGSADSLLSFVEGQEQDQPEPVDIHEQRATQRKIRQLLSKLDQRSADIMRRRYGLKTGVAETHEKIGRRYKITAERVRQIEAAAIAQLRPPEQAAESSADDAEQLDVAV